MKKKNRIWSLDLDLHSISTLKLLLLWTIYLLYLNFLTDIRKATQKRIFVLLAMTEG